ncbi:hypothetical protein BC937DRAFT_91973 [Endogone sp. FLAS-F59071]|nr:hypothetical protein BC937DRAFT_91973 [Endogone sp. FLAS-F59071]|eukprot:RUS15807.1 hypothetical protein BC937DRAFT_91973 [Endogone sp. FLAS-F59071]
MSFFDRFAEAENSKHFGVEELKKHQSASLPAVEPQDLTGKVIIVTGANTGIGYEAAKTFAAMNAWKVILACRDRTKAENAVALIAEETGSAAAEAWDLDLSSFKSVKAFAKKFGESGLKLHLLVSNAGVGGLDFHLTEDGYETTLQINHLSNMLLVLLLTPHLERTAKLDNTIARIVVVASEMHFFTKFSQRTSEHPILALNDPLNFDTFERYPTTKLLNILLAQEYSRRLGSRPLFICSANPGWTVSELMSNDRKGPKRDSTPRSMGPFVQRTTAEGTKTIIYSSIDPKVLESNGAFFSNVALLEPSTYTTGNEGRELADKVWKDSLNAIGAEELGLESWLVE